MEAEEKKDKNGEDKESKGMEDDRGDGGIKDDVKGGDDEDPRSQEDRNDWEVETNRNADSNKEEGDTIDVDNEERGRKL